MADPLTPPPDPTPQDEGTKRIRDFAVGELQRVIGWNRPPDVREELTEALDECWHRSEWSYTTPDKAADLLLTALSARGLEVAPTDPDDATAFPLREQSRLMAEATAHLLDRHSCDHDGYEVWRDALVAPDMREAIRAALDELGVPGPGYPAPVANAVAILRAALGVGEAAPSTEAAHVLANHYVTAIDCDHEAKTDTVRCVCSVWTGTPQPSVGAAVREWVAHVLAALGEAAPTLDPRPITREQEVDLARQMGRIAAEQEAMKALAAIVAAAGGAVDVPRSLVLEGLDLLLLPGDEEFVARYRVGVARPDPAPPESGT